MLLKKKKLKKRSESARFLRLVTRRRSEKTQMHVHRVCCYTRRALDAKTEKKITRQIGLIISNSFSNETRLSGKKTDRIKKKSKYFIGIVRLLAIYEKKIKKITTEATAHKTECAG